MADRADRHRSVAVSSFVMKRQPCNSDTQAKITFRVVRNQNAQRKQTRACMYVCVVLGELHCPAPFKETDQRVLWPTGSCSYICCFTLPQPDCSVFSDRNVTDTFLPQRPTDNTVQRMLYCTSDAENSFLPVMNYSPCYERELREGLGEVFSASAIKITSSR